MPIEKYMQHPALKPTILVGAVLENVYRPDGRESQKPEPPPATRSPAPERDRAA